MGESLSGKARSSVLWNTGFNLFRDALQFVVMMVLVRLLDPADYGQFNLANSITGFLSVFSLRNFIDHVIQVRSDDEVHYQDHFTAGVVIQGSAFVAANLLAVALSCSENFRPIATIIHCYSFCFLLEWPFLLRAKMIERELDWKRLRLLHAVGLLLTSSLSLLMAWQGAGAFALVLPGMFVTLPFIYDLFVVIKWRPNWHFNRDNYRPAWRFGLSRLGSGVIFTARPLVENTIMVQVLGFAAAGFFGRAVGLSNMFCGRLADQLMQAIYPVVTRLEVGSARYRRMSGLVLQVVAWVAIPVACLFSWLSTPIVQFVYGGKWDNVIPLIPWAMAAAAILATVHTVSRLLLAHHGHKTCLKIDLFVFFAHLATLATLLPMGMKIYLKGIVVLHAITFTLFFSALVRQQGIMVSAFAEAYLPPLLLSTASIMLLRAIPGGFFEQVEDFSHALAAGFFFLLFYVFLLRFAFPALTRQLMMQMPLGDRICKALLYRKPV